MTPDEALLKAWQLGERADGWSDAVMAEAERLLPLLLAAGYAKTDQAKWSFTPKGVARAMDLEEALADGDKA